MLFGFWKTILFLFEIETLKIKRKMQHPNTSQVRKYAIVLICVYIIKCNFVLFQCATGQNKRKKHNIDTL